MYVDILLSFLIFAPMTDNQRIFMNMIAYIANLFEGRTVDFHKLSKILYFAERKHLARFGSNLVEDTFIAMEHGPVPSAIYDLLKALKFSPETVSEELREALSVVAWRVTANVDADLDWLSESEVSCLNESYEENKNMGFKALSEKSHDIAWKANTYMRTDMIAKAEGVNEEMLTYIRSHSEDIYYPTHG